jgi:hypothetical protein
MTLRWEDYLLFKNDSFHSFWKKHLSNERNVLFILGQGFDPRMCLCSKSILEKSGTGKRDFILIKFEEGENSPSKEYRHDVDTNLKQLEALVLNVGTIIPKSIQMETSDGHRIGPRESANAFNDFNEFKNYSDIVIDISSLPFDIYMPLIGKILFILDKEKNISTSVPNLHITVAENTVIDKSIKKSGLSDDASYLHGFTGSLETISSEEEPTVWIPILGEGEKEQIELIGNLVSAKEICPVLPFPSRNPRRGDDLMLEYRSLLIERLSIESRNIIYAAEQNPFEAYREIHKAIEHYRRSLMPLGKCKFAISSLSSKLISLGAFLISYEEGITNKQKVGIAYVESQGYDMKKGASSKENISSCELFSLWISGDCYDLQ